MVTANKAVIARHGTEIAQAAAAAGVLVPIEAAVGEASRSSNRSSSLSAAIRINRVSGIINGTTNYILTRMADEGAAYADVLAEAQRLGYAEADPAADDGCGRQDRHPLDTRAFAAALIGRASRPKASASSREKTWTMHGNWATA